MQFVPQHLHILLQDLQDVAEADIESLGLKAVAKNRLLRLLSSQKVRTATKWDSICAFVISDMHLKQFLSSTDT